LDKLNSRFDIESSYDIPPLSKLACVYVDTQKNIIASDYNKDFIQIINPTFKEYKRFGMRENFDGPCGIVVDEARNNLYVVDSNNHRIQVYSLYTIPITVQLATQITN